eukprot:TRINITY_DN16864_c0_g3_i1.p1 TRINITY_DN16864_c0_g3~~TRINITY_DN16864_c0_g3_i1.p1  ORF type:complete len:116 (+),score=35.61 TRINITY_DN16864_c0_g3_i1:74-421(+)
MPGFRTESSNVRSMYSAGTADVLPKERAGASFDVAELRRALWGKSADAPSPAEEFKHLFAGAPFNDADMDALRSYEDLWRTTLKRSTAAIQIIRENPKLMAAHKVQRNAAIVSAT